MEVMDSIFSADLDFNQINEENKNNAKSPQIELIDLIEGLLLSSDEPLAFEKMTEIFLNDFSRQVQDISEALLQLQKRWQHKALNLKETASGWRFYTALAFKPYVDHLYLDKTPKYSRATLETLAVIVYQQPVTRSDIEQIRGVAVNPQIIKTLIDRGWIEVIGQREVPGRPFLYATTKQFLDDLGVKSIQALPSLIFQEEENIHVNI
jgi:segregation and condensation protein B